jgi:hypothetical protein
MPNVLDNFQDLEAYEPEIAIRDQRGAWVAEAAVS